MALPLPETASLLRVIQVRRRPTHRRPAIAASCRESPALPGRRTPPPPLPARAALHWERMPARPPTLSAEPLRRARRGRILSRLARVSQKRQARFLRPGARRRARRLHPAPQPAAETAARALETTRPWPRRAGRHRVPPEPLQPPALHPPSSTLDRPQRATRRQATRIPPGPTTAERRTTTRLRTATQAPRWAIPPSPPRHPAPPPHSRARRRPGTDPRAGAPGTGRRTEDDAWTVSKVWGGALGVGNVKACRANALRRRKRPRRCAGSASARRSAPAEPV